MSNKTEPPDREGLVKISTDGSSFRNGKKDAVAVVGVYFGAGDSRQVTLLRCFVCPRLVIHYLLKHFHFSPSLAHH